MIIPKIKYNFTTLLTAVIIGHFQIWNYEITLLHMVVLFAVAFLRDHFHEKILIMITDTSVFFRY